MIWKIGGGNCGLNSMNDEPWKEFYGGILDLKCRRQGQGREGGGAWPATCIFSNAYTRSFCVITK